VKAAADRPLVFAIRFAAYRPAGTPLPALEVSIGDVAVGRVVEIKPGFGEYRYALSERAAADVRGGATILTLRSDTFVPKLAGAGEDARSLGVAVDWVGLEEEGGRK
jgi:hypothetical protein